MKLLQILREAVDHYTGDEIKKVYVSIKNKENTIHDLVQRRLEGIIGVSTSKYNVSEWFVYRDILLVMPFKKFVEINNTHQINYTNPHELMTNDMDLFYRLYDRKHKNGVYDKTGSDKLHVVRNVGEKILPEIYALARYFTHVDDNKANDLYHVQSFLNPSNTGKFYDFLSKKQINSPEDYAQYIIEFLPLYEDRYRWSERPVTLTVEDIMDSVNEGIIYAGNIYKDESEWLLTDKILNIPEGTQLFFELKGYPKEYNDELKQKLEQYHLNQLYKINFVQYKDLNRYQMMKWNNKTTKFVSNVEQRKQKVEEQKKEALEKTYENLLHQFKQNLDEAFKDWERDFEYYVIDDGNDTQRISEPYIYSEPFQRRLNEVLHTMKEKFNEYFNRDIKDITKHTFDLFLYDLKSEMRNTFREKEQDEEETVLNTNYNPTSVYPFYRMVYASIENVNDKELLVTYKKVMQREMYKLYGKDVNI